MRKSFIFPRLLSSPLLLIILRDFKWVVQSALLRDNKVHSLIRACFCSKMSYFRGPVMLRELMFHLSKPLCRCCRRPLCFWVQGTSSEQRSERVGSVADMFCVVFDQRLVHLLTLTVSSFFFFFLINCPWPSICNILSSLWTVAGVA